jgi:predicted ester cyclase
VAFPDDDGRRSPAGCYVELRGAPASARGSVEDAFADVRGTIRGAVSADDTVAQEILWEGTHTGPMQTPGRTLEPSGVQIRVEASVWARFDGGKAREVHHYLDVLTLVHQLGR